jgi:hypothetical protein
MYVLWRPVCNDLLHPFVWRLLVLLSLLIALSAGPIASEQPVRQLSGASGAFSPAPSSSGSGDIHSHSTPATRACSYSFFSSSQEPFLQPCLSLLVGFRHPPSICIRPSLRSPMVSGNPPNGSSSECKDLPTVP